MATIEKKELALAWLAKQLVGAIETRPNGGPLVEKFQRAVDGISSGEPWCVGFVQYCAQAIDDLALLLNGGMSQHALARTEWTIALHEQSPLKHVDPKLGRIVVWRSVANENRGHCGIVTEVVGSDVYTVEGNTSLASGDQREGDGVWHKVRHRGDLPGFERLGYLGVWQ